MIVPFRRPRAAARAAFAFVVCTALAASLHAQTPTTATLTQWDLFTATGATADASQNVAAVFMDVSGIAGPAGSVWLTTQYPKPRLGRLSPSLTTNNYVEWRPVNSPESGGAPLGLTLNRSNGDLWVATQGDPSLMLKVGNSDTFRKYRGTYPLTVQGITVAVDHAAIVALPTKNASGIGDAIVKVPRASGEGTVTMQIWFVGGQPQQVALDNSGNIWYTARTTNKLARLNPATGQVTEWTIPAGTIPAGLHVSGTRVCVVSAGTTGGVNGVAHCLNVSTNQFTRYARAVGDGFDVPQRIAFNSDNEVFITEQRNSTISFVANAAQAGAPLTTVNPTNRTVSPKKATLTVTEATFTPTTYTVPSADTALTGVDNGSGFVRFPLPRPTLTYPYAQTGFPQPLGITPVFDDAGRGTGSVFVGEYFNGPAAGRQAAAILDRFVVGVAPVVKTIITNPATLRFDATAGAPAPGSQAVAIEEVNGQALSWTAAESAAWLSVAPASGAAPSSMTVTVDHSSLAAGTHTTTITIDDGPGNADAKTIEVTLNVTAAPALARSPATLTFAQSAGITPPAQTIDITNTGGGTLEWTASANQTWLHLGAESGTAPASLAIQVDAEALSAGTYNGTITITAPGAANSPLTVAVSVTVSNTTPIITLSAASFSFSATRGGAAPAAQTLTISNTGGGTLAWSAGDDAAWLTLSPVSGSATPGSPSTVTLTADQSELARGTYTATITIADPNAQNSPQTVDVTFTVTAPTIGLSPASIPLSVVKTAASPANQNVTISNTGDAPLSYTASVTSGNSWLSIAAGGSGTIAASGSGTLTLAFNTGSLAKGVYTGTVEVADPNATNTPQPITVTLTVTAPTISPSPASLSFTVQPGQNPASQTVTITNTGDATLTFTPSVGTTSGGGWLSVSPATQSTVAPSANVVLTVNIASSSLAAGSYNGTITIADATASNTPQVVNVSLTVAAAPVLAVSPTTITVAADKGGANPANQTVTIGNTGSSSLTYTATVTSGAWLSVVSGGSGTVAPSGSASVVLGIDITGLAKGVHTGTVEVSAPGAGNSPQTITVNLTVRAPIIGVSPASLNYSVLRTRNPATQTITLSNTGDAALTFTASASTNSGGSWLAVSPASGTVAAGGSTTLTVTVTSASLTTGSYTGSVSVADANATNTPQSTSVSLTVNPAPTISLNAASRTFTVTQTLNPASQTVTVTNTGDASLTFTPSVTMNEGAGWLAVSPSGPTTVAAGNNQVVTITITSAGLAPGVYTGSITIADANATNTPQTVSVTLTVNAAPVISRSPATLTFSAKRTSNPATQSITLTNSGGATMNFTAGATTDGGGSWLAVSPTSGVLGAGQSATLTVTVTSASLATGSYTGTITLSDPAAPNSPQTTAVSLTVTAPAITLNPTTLTFNTTTGVNPSSQTFQVGNSGDAELIFTPSVVMNNGTGWLAVAPSGQSTVNAGGSATLTVNITSSALSAGTYTGSISIADAAATNTPQSVGITVVVTAPGILTVSPTTHTKTATKGGANPANFSSTISNTGSTAFTYSSSASSTGNWLSIVSGGSGTLNPSDSATLTMAINITGLAKGNHVGTVTVTAPGAQNSPTVITVNLTVQAGTITLNPTSIALGSRKFKQASPANQNVTISNTGDATLTYSAAVTAGGTWLSIVGGSSGALAPGGSGTIALAFNTSTLASGSYTGTITVTDPNSSNSPQTLNVTLTVTPAPFIVVVPTSLSYTTLQRWTVCNATNQAPGTTSASQTFSLQNTGDATLNFTMTPATVSGGSWLSASAAGGATSVAAGGSLTITVTTTTNPVEGPLTTTTARSGSVTVSDSNATNGSDVVSISFTPQAAPATLCISPTSSTSSRISLGSIVRQSTGGSGSISVQNVGDASFTWTSTQSSSRGTINRNPSSGTVPANSSTTVNLTVSTTAHTGTQTGQVNITPSVGSVQSAYFTWTVTSS